MHVLLYHACMVNENQPQFILALQGGHKISKSQYFHTHRKLYLNPSAWADQRNRKGE